MAAVLTKLYLVHTRNKDTTKRQEMGLLDFLFGKRTDNKKTQMAVAPKKIRNTKQELTPSVIAELKERYIAFDTETTGLSYATDRIVELGAVVFERGVPVKQFSSLVNPGIRIPTAASDVNHITNEMLMSAPKEEDVYPKFIEFMGDALKGGTIIAGHYAIFDILFLMDTFKRMGYEADIRYVDTLSLSKEHMRLNNYKQDTVAAAFDITNREMHRATSDAEVCGKILWNLIELHEDKRRKEQEMAEKAAIKKAEQIEKSHPAGEELEICAYIQKMILDRGGDVKHLRYYKNSGGYVDVISTCSLIKFKIATKKKYIIVPIDMTTPELLPVEECTKTELGEYYKRLHFKSAMNLAFLGDYIFTRYQRSSKPYYTTNDNPYKEQWLGENYNNMTSISIEKMEELIKQHVIRIEEQKASEEALKAEIEAKEAAKARRKALAEEKKNAPKIQKPAGKAILQMDDDGNILNEFPSLTAASAKIGVSQKCIRSCAIGEQKHAAGFVWKYKAEYGQEEPDLHDE